MSNNNKEEFDISKVIELARVKKYEATVAGFAALDKIEKINIPKKLKTRKAAVQALYALSEGLIKYDYFTAEQRQKLDAEARKSDAPYKTSHSIPSAAPVVEEDLEEENIPEDEPKTDFFASSEDGEDGESEEADDEEEEDDDDDFDDDDSFDDDDEEEVVEPEEEEV